MSNKKILKEEVLDNLRHNILKFWQERMFCPEGGFYGAMTSDGVVHTDAPRGGVLNARILWTFSAAYRILGDEEYLRCATHAKEYLLAHFCDRQTGAFKWCLDSEGNPVDTKNQFYALGFATYALSEYSRATGDEETLAQAKLTFSAIEQHSYNSQAGGYIEATTQDWQPLADLRLSEKDDNAPMSMNTHLHILEAYTNLYRVWRGEELRNAIVKMLRIFIDHIYNPANDHLSLFFDMEWRRLDGIHSYGHDIEATWLLLEAAHEIGDVELTAEVKTLCAKVAKVSFEGLREDGSMIYERHTDGSLDTDRHWWVQAECIVGLMWLAKYHNNAYAESLAMKCWGYIKRELVDFEGGEWWWSRHEDGSINMAEDKAGMWKCPYHNSRMCLEVITL